MADQRTTVDVSHDTWRKLNRRKEPGQTFNDVIKDALQNGD